MAAATTSTTAAATTTTARTVLPRRVRGNANTTTVGWLTAGPIAVAVAATSSRTHRGYATVGAGALTARFIIMSVAGDGSRTGSNANPAHVRIDSNYGRRGRIGVDFFLVAVPSVGAPAQV